MNRTIACDLDRTIRRDLELFRLLRSTIDIDKDLITRAYDIARRGSDVHVRLKREGLFVENVTAKHHLTIVSIVVQFCLLDLFSGHISRRSSLHLLGEEDVAS